MRTLIWVAVCGPALVVAAGAGAQQATIPDACPQGELRGADGRCIPNTGAGESGNPGGGTAAVEAAKGGAAAEPNEDLAPADKSQLGPGAVGPSTGEPAIGGDGMPNAAGAGSDATGASANESQ